MSDSAPSSGPATRPTARQTQVVTLIREGLGTKEIAQRLGISSNAVKAHVAKLLRKYDVANRAALVEAVSHATAEDHPAQPRLRELVRDSPFAIGAVLDALPSGVVLADTDGHHILNRAALRLLGLAEAPECDVQAPAGWAGLIDVDTGLPARADDTTLAHALAGIATTRTYLQMRADGERRLRARGEPIRNAAGAIIGAVTVLDVDEATPRARTA